MSCSIVCVAHLHGPLFAVFCLFPFRDSYPPRPLRGLQMS